MNAKILFIFILAVFLFTGCKECEQRVHLFHQDYQSHPIPVTEDMQLGTFLDKMDSLYCIQNQELNWPVLMIDEENLSFAADNSQGKLIGIEPTPCVQVEFDLQQILEIIKDGNNYEVEGVRVPFDSIQSYVLKHYLNYGKDSRFSKNPLGVGIWLIADSKTTMKELIPVIDMVSNGFDDVCEQYSQDQFDKSVCDLSPEEYQQMKELFPFHLAFKLYDKAPEINISW